MRSWTSVVAPRKRWIGVGWPRPFIAAGLALAATVLAILVVLESKSIQYGVPIADLLGSETVALWTYEMVTGDGLLSPTAPAVKVRWRESVDGARRGELERRYTLEPIEPRERNTWVYRLRNVSHTNVSLLVDDTAVDDVEGFDRRLKLAVPAEPLSAALERLVAVGVAHPIVRRLDETRRDRATTVVRKLADPIVQWMFFGSVGVCAMVIGAFRTRHAMRPWAIDVASAVGSLFLGVEGNRAVWIGVCLALVAVPIAVAPRTLARPTMTGTPFEEHAIDLALTRAMCGTTSSVSEASVASVVSADRSLRTVPLRTVAERVGGSFEKYCASVRPFRNEENSPMLVMAGVLLANPAISLDALGLRLTGIKLALIALVVGFGVMMRWSVVAVTLIGLVAADVLDRVANTFVQYSFDGVVLLAVAFAWSFVWCLNRRRSAAVAALLLGIASGFGTHLRTSHLPIYLAFFLLFVVLALIDSGRWSRTDSSAGSKARWLGETTLMFVLGYLMFTGVFIQPITRTTRGLSNYTTHPVAHPLVLSLSLTSEDALQRPAVPGNPLAAREGFGFDDEQGLALARRIDPAAEYLGPTYEAALWQYYFRLWRMYPGEMIAIYLQKFQLVHTSFVRYVQADAAPVVMALAGTVLTRGWWPASASVFWVFVVTFAVALVPAIRLRSSLAVAAAFLSMGAALVYLEAALTTPMFQLIYHNFAPMCLGAIIVIALQAGVRWAWHRASWHR